MAVLDSAGEATVEQHEVARYEGEGEGEEGDKHNTYLNQDSSALGMHIEACSSELTCIVFGLYEIHNFSLIHSL